MWRTSFLTSRRAYGNSQKRHVRVFGGGAHPTQAKERRAPSRGSAPLASPTTDWGVSSASEGRRSRPLADADPELGRQLPRTRASFHLVHLLERSERRHPSWPRLSVNPAD